MPMPNNFTWNWSQLNKAIVRRELGGWKSLLSIPIPLPIQSFIQEGKNVGQHLVPEVQPSTHITFPLLHHLVTLQTREFNKGRERLDTIKEQYERLDGCSVESCVPRYILDVVYARINRLPMSGVCCGSGVPFLSELPYYLMGIDEILAIEGAELETAVAEGWLTLGTPPKAGTFVRRGQFHAQVRAAKRKHGEFEQNVFSCRRCAAGARIFLYHGIQRQIALSMWYGILAWYVNGLIESVNSCLRTIMLPMSIAQRERLVFLVINHIADENTPVKFAIDYELRSGDGILTLSPLHRLCGREQNLLSAFVSSHHSPVEVANAIADLLPSCTRPRLGDLRNIFSSDHLTGARRLWLPSHYYRSNSLQ